MYTIFYTVEVASLLKTAGQQDEVRSLLPAASAAPASSSSRRRLCDCNCCSTNASSWSLLWCEPFSAAYTGASSARGATGMYVSDVVVLACAPPNIFSRIWRRRCSFHASGSLLSSNRLGFTLERSPSMLLDRTKNNKQGARGSVVHKQERTSPAVTPTG
ncbi:hypothetical protein STCU_07082 [Strigomonas culicis]|uniref:Uncharacterized protein n=1 Tax=Strigomonas culicis TaxID=28005 RepID=S9U782_9TRYP|nr:hypothetical protein STCU_07082 [Strigomonas culicis]|eukprot:EPY24634.1 hypothetical protein STCU_07082 [Strigomonas culicis]